MKYLFLLGLSVFLTACDTSEEDRNFYYNGWMKPETDAEKRMYGTSGNTARLPAPPVESISPPPSSTQ